MFSRVWHWSWTCHNCRVPTKLSITAPAVVMNLETYKNTGDHDRAIYYSIDHHHRQMVLTRINTLTPIKISRRWRWWRVFVYLFFLICLFFFCFQPVLLRDTNCWPTFDTDRNRVRDRAELLDRRRRWRRRWQGDGKAEPWPESAAGAGWTQYFTGAKEWHRECDRRRTLTWVECDCYGTKCLGYIY